MAWHLRGCQIVVAIRDSSRKLTNFDESEADRDLDDRDNDVISDPSLRELTGLSQYKIPEVTQTHVPVLFQPGCFDIVHMQATPIDVCTNLAHGVANQEDLEGVRKGSSSTELR